MNELIDALRCYGKVVPMECPNMDCKYNVLGTCERERMARDAADAIERLTDEVDRKDKALQKMLTLLAKHEAENADFIVYTSKEAKDRVVRMKEKMKKTKDELIQRLCDHCDTTPEEKLKEGCCEGCPIIGEGKEVFDND